jgi:hypothetical protein
VPADWQAARQLVGRARGSPLVIRLGREAQPVRAPAELVAVRPAEHLAERRAELVAPRPAELVAPRPAEHLGERPAEPVAVRPVAVRPAAAPSSAPVQGRRVSLGVAEC